MAIFAAGLGALPFLPHAAAGEPVPSSPALSGAQAMQGEETPDTDRARWVREASFTETILVAKLARADAVAQTRSEPPTTRYTLTLAEVETLRGEPAGETVRLSYAHTQGRPGRPVPAQRFIVLAEGLNASQGEDAEGEGDAEKAGEAKNPERGNAGIAAVGGRVALGGEEPTAGRARALVPATADRILAARMLANLPMGWTLNDAGKVVSPWAEAGLGWPDKTEHDFGDGPRDARTGRPALTVPEGVAFRVEPIIPEKTRRFVNPFGNGRFRVTVRNTTEQPLEVPALLTVPAPAVAPVPAFDEGDIAWANSVLIIEDNTVHVLDAATKPDPRVKPVTLAPGQSVSTAIDTLKLSGVDWPRGGSRVYFRFALGDRVAESFFYYRSDFHDTLRRERVE